MFRAKHLRVGSIGEEACCWFLKKRGWKIILRNYKKSFGEIDIIAKPNQGPLVFVEVKTLEKSANRQNEENQYAELKPEDNLSQSKLEKLKKTCAFFANNNPDLIDKTTGWRIDLISIIITPQAQEISNEELLTNIEKYCIIKQYENVF